MAKNAPDPILDDDRESPPLTEEEKAALERAEADIAAGRLHSHEDVSKWLRRRAAEIVERARKRDGSR